MGSIEHFYYCMTLIVMPTHIFIQPLPDLQMKPYRTDEYVHKLFYETARFSAFNQQWVVKARINNSQRDPHQSNERTITYQLILKTKTSTPMSIHFFALKGPFSDMKVSTQIYKHEFTETVS